jgi:hypothetical protein
MTTDMARNAELIVETIMMSGESEKMIVIHNGCAEREQCEEGGHQVSERVTEGSDNSNMKKAGWRL